MLKESKKVTVIIPAYNEKKNIKGVLDVVTRSNLIDEVIVVNDGSRDKTSQVVKEFGSKVKLIENKKNRGKGYSVKVGAGVAKNPLLFFCDADLIGLTEKHIRDLILPVKRGEVEMVTGAAENMCSWRENTLFRKIFPKKRQKDDFILNLGGQKVLWKKDFLETKNSFGSGYELEQVIVNHFVRGNKSYKKIELEGLGHVWKVKKWGLKGLLKEIVALFIFARQYIKFELLRRR